MKIITLKTGEQAFIDDIDFDIVSKQKWYRTTKSQKGIYARAYINGKNILMHRFILNIYDRRETVDHKDHNGLNNQRKNIRLTNQSENCKNRLPFGSSHYLGVHFHENRNWVAQIKIEGKHIYIGSFWDEIEAAIAFNMKAISTGSEFHNLNKMKGYSNKQVISRPKRENNGTDFKKNDQETGKHNRHSFR